MMIETRNLLWLLPLLVLLTVPLWRPPLADFLQPAAYDAELAGPQPTGGRTFTMEDVVLHQNKNGKDEWRLNTDSIVTEDGEKNFRMKNVDAVFFGSGSQGRTHITSSRGNYNTEEGVLTLTEDVVVTTENGYEMHAPIMRYMERNRQINSEQGVRITGKKIDIRGRDMVYDMKTGNYRLSGQVVGDMW